MLNKFVPTTLVALMALSSSAYSQSTVIIEETHPAMPGEVRTYILEQQVPSIVYEGDVVIGEVVPEIVEIYPVEGNPDYAYTIVNEQRILVDPQTRTIIGVIE